MALEDLLEAFETARTQRFVHTTQKRAQMRSIAQDIAAYKGKPLYTKDIRALDDIALALKRRQDTELSDIINDIDAARSYYRPQRPLTAYQLISTNYAQYDTRIQEVHHFLSTNDTCYDDLALTKDWLQTNSYLQNKRNTNDVFDRVARDLEECLETRMRTYRPKRAQSTLSTSRKLCYECTQPSRARTHTRTPQSRTSREHTSWYERATTAATRLAVGVSAVLVTLAALPTAWYAPLYQ